MTHLGYITAAYGLAAAVLVALIVWVRLDTARQRRRLATLEKAAQAPGSGGGAP